MASDPEIVSAARALKSAHIAADILGGDSGKALARAYADLLDAVGDVEEPAEVTAYRTETAALKAEGQPQAATLNTDGQVQP